MRCDSESNGLVRVMRQVLWEIGVHAAVTRMSSVSEYETTKRDIKCCINSHQMEIYALIFIGIGYIKLS